MHAELKFIPVLSDIFVDLSQAYELLRPVRTALFTWLTEHPGLFTWLTEHSELSEFVKLS
jgi:hypothetical protein